MVIPFTRYTQNPDGTLFVEGVATNDALDLDEQIIDRGFARKGLQSWFQDWGNVRQMHATNLPPAGKAVEMRELDNGDYWVRTHVVEPTAVQLVKNRVYQAYSVGISKPRIIADHIAKNGRVVDGVFSEISLVDFPANPTCKFTLAKMAGGQLEVVEKVTPAMLAKIRTGATEPDDEPEPEIVITKAAVESATWYALVKRNFDPGVGGGVDRDQIDEKDFAGPHRSYPIVTPGDVDDASKLIGHADNPDQVKSNIISIAHRKGQAFVDQLPDEWKGGDKAAGVTVDLTKDDAAGADGEDDGMKECPTCEGKGKIMEGHRQCPDCKGSGNVPHDFKKSAEPDAVKRSDAERGLDAHQEPDGDEEGPDIDGDGDGSKPVAKARREYQDGEKKPFDGAAKPFTKEGDDDGDGKVDDDGDDGDDDGDAQKIAYHTRRLHDATCCAFREEDVLIAHPAVVKGIGMLVDPERYREQINKALGDPTQAADVARLGLGFGLAVKLRNADQDALDAGMIELRKAFADYYPDAHPTPTDIQPGQFKRPYIGAGHAPLNGGTSPRIPLASHVPDPKQFTRGDITDGHERGAPAKAGQPDLVKNAGAAGAAAGMGGATAASTLTAMHDYIAQQSPGVCPMDPFTGAPAAPIGDQGSSVVGDLAATTHLDMRAGARPTPASPGPAHQSAALSIQTSAVPDLVKVHQDGSIEFTGTITSPSGAILDSDTLARVVGDAVAQHTATLTGEVDTLTKRVRELEAQPDPAFAAVRGPAALASLQKVQTVAGHGDTGVDEAAAELARLVKAARHPDTTVSGPALAKLLTKARPEDVADLISPPATPR